MSRHIREELSNALSHRSSSVRERAVEALAQDSTEEGFELLLGMTRDRSALVRMRAVESLGSRRDARAVGILRMLLRDADWGVRLNTVEVLGRLPARNATADLVRVMRTDVDPLVRGYAAEAIGYLRAKDVRPALERALEHEREGCARLRIVVALYHLGQRRRWREVIPYLKDPDYRVRCAAVTSLEELASPKRMGEIRNLLGQQASAETTRAVRTTIEAALARMNAERE